MPQPKVLKFTKSTQYFAGSRHPDQSLRQALTSLSL
jgi:hypothetical protein